MPDPGRSYEVSALTTHELERTRRYLAASLALARPGSPACVPITAQISAIDTELAHRNRAGPSGSPHRSRDQA
jgi:hypothetical protein